MATLAEIDAELARRGVKPPPSRAAIDAELQRRGVAIPQQQPEEERTFAQTALGTLEAGAALVSGAVAEPAAGIAGGTPGLLPPQPCALGPRGGARNGHKQYGRAAASFVAS